MGYPDSDLRRLDRVYHAALALLLHRNGPGAVYEAKELERCAQIAVALNAKTEAALGATQPDPFKEEV